MRFLWRKFDVVAHLAPMRRYARTLTRHHEDAEDLVQTALLRAYDRRSSFKAGQDLRAWLMAILHNVYIDGWRSRSAEEDRITLWAEAMAAHAAPAQEHAAELGRIQRLFLDLPEEQRAAFHLVVIEGLSYDQAALVLEVPPGTVMSRLSRARASLRADEATPATRSTTTFRIVGGAHDPKR
jgi:RNA polymerase sigma-70 factor (ECF subfamily)